MHADELRPEQIRAVEAMLLCRDPRNGFVAVHCDHCDVTEFRPLSCNSPFCTRCGKPYVDRWADKAVKRMLNVNHSHIIFTLHRDLWSLIRDKWECFKELSEAAFQIMKEVMSEQARQDITPGMITALHTFGQDIKYNIHLHTIASDGGLTKKGRVFREVYYFPYRVLRRKWQQHALEVIQRFVDEDIEYLLHNYDGFNVKRIKAKIPKKELVGYIARYLRHPPISDRRIVNYDGKNVTIICESKQTKQKWFVDFTVDGFIGSLIQHIPKKGFKMIRSYGIYSRRKKAVIMKKEFCVESQETITKYFVEKDGLRCRYCRRVMSVLGYYIPNRGKPPPNEIIQLKIEQFA